MEPLLSHRRRWEHPNSFRNLAVQVRQLDYWKLRPAANSMPLPQAKTGLWQLHGLGLGCVSPASSPEVCVSQVALSQFSCDSKASASSCSA